MTNDYDKLRAMKACEPALRWIGDRTIEQAWRDCERSDWMCWLLRRIAPNPNDRRSDLAAADMAERVWNLIHDEPTRLTAAWAISATRRGNADEMRTASATAYEAAAAAAAYATYAAASAAYVTYAAAEAAAGGRLEHAADNAASAADNAAFASAYDDSTYDDYAYAAESAAQADILRKYYSAREIGKLFRQAPA